MLDALFAFIWAVLLTLFLLPTLMRVSFYTDVLDKPTARKLHGMPVPLLGGLGMYTALLTGTLFFGQAAPAIQVLLAGAFLLCLLGLKDDIMCSSPLRRLVIQVVAATILLVLGDVRITTLHGVLGVDELPVAASYALSILVIVGLTNAFNLIDGINGLLGAFTLFCALCLLFFMGVSAYTVPLAALCGAMLAFLRYNLIMPRMFMGDSGALVCGYVLSATLITLMETQAHPVVPALALAICFYPVFDTLRTAYVRVRALRSPFQGDRGHTHHILCRAGLSSVQAIIVILSINASSVGVVYFLRDWPNDYLLVLLCGEAIVLHLLLSLLAYNRPVTPAAYGSRAGNVVRYFTHMDVVSRQN